MINRYAMKGGNKKPVGSNGIPRVVLYLNYRAGLHFRQKLRSNASPAQPERQATAIELRELPPERAHLSWTMA
jgi:hypothetical protein